MAFDIDTSIVTGDPAHVQHHIDLAVAVNDVGSREVYYTGTVWPARGSNPLPVTFYSTKHVSAPEPSTAVIGDIWIQHPDAIGA